MNYYIRMLTLSFTAGTETGSNHDATNTIIISSATGGITIIVLAVLAVIIIIFCCERKN